MDVILFSKHSPRNKMYSDLINPFYLHYNLENVLSILSLFRCQ